MSSVDPAKIIQRIDELLGAQLPTDTSANIYAAVVESYQSTLTLVTTLYGASSHQALTLLKAAEMARQNEGHLSHNFTRVSPVVQGALRSMRADIEAGLVGNIERRVAGELLGDLLGLAKEALATGNEGTTHRPY